MISCVRTAMYAVEHTDESYTQPGFPVDNYIDVVRYQTVTRGGL